MTDKELLQLAAKAAGIELHSIYSEQEFIGYMASPGSWSGGWFDPLTDDGDALRLAVKLQMVVGIYPTKTNVTADGVFLEEFHGDDPYAATRMAIVRAAAEIGKGIK